MHNTRESALADAGLPNKDRRINKVDSHHSPNTGYMGEDITSAPRTCSPASTLEDSESWLGAYGL